MVNTNKHLIFVSQKQTTMRIITKINTWRSKSGEFRVYVSFKGETEQGCYYKDGNSYQPKGTLINMSIEEKKEAMHISSLKHGQNNWGVVYENEIITIETKKRFSRDTENWMPNKMKDDFEKGFPINPADYLNM